MSFYIPTYEECLSIVTENPKMCFYEKRYIIDDYILSIFGYRLASYNNFMLPIIERSNINALELKGISYVFNDDMTVYRHYLMLHKFWELDQYDHCSLDKFSNKKIKNITEKLDGNLFTFIKLPSGKILSQSKKGVLLNNNIEANNFLLKPNYFNFIKNCLDRNLQPIFELVDGNSIVKYDEQSLMLLKLRCNLTGKYFDISHITEVPVVKEYNYTFDDILKLKSEMVGIEGWVVHFDDDSMLKVKTDWWKNEKANKLL
jgi:T4 RnlA family RNA ligase